MSSFLCSKANFLCSKVLRFVQKCQDLLLNKFCFFESFSFRYKSLMYKCFFIFCNVFSFRYRTFSSFQVSFSNLKFSLFKSKVFFVQKQRFLCSKAKICSKVERFVLQKFFQIKISFRYRSFFSNVDLLLYQVSICLSFSCNSSETVCLFKKKHQQFFKVFLFCFSEGKCNCNSLLLTTTKYLEHQEVSQSISCPTRKNASNIDFS